MASFLLEIGAEELPVAFLASAPAEFVAALCNLLAHVGITVSPENIQAFAAPRRLAWFIQNLPDYTQSKTERLKGPPLRVALNEASSQPTQAGLGFAQKMNVAFEALEQSEGYLWHTQTTPGKPLPALLSENLPALISNLSGAHFMRWQADTTTDAIKFSRPIRWLTALWDDQLVSFSLASVQSDCTSRGLRLTPDILKISHANDYLRQLRVQGQVEPDEAVRHQWITTQLDEAASKAGGRLVSNEALLSTVARMNESATVFMGQFDASFLALPACVLTTVLASHQKLFAVKNPHKNKLLPVFLGVCNNPNPEALPTIAAGNERVVRARFQDATFFFQSDRQQALHEYTQKLNGVTFQKNLATMHDKTLRLIPLCEAVGQSLKLSDEDLQHAQRAASLAKADLVTLLVREFTELQGELGAEYARLDGEPQAVANAIATQYHPRGEGESIDHLEPAAIALNLADKLDTLVAIFSQKDAKLPTGSKDPLGLRRAASGMLQILLKNNLKIAITPLLKAAHRQLEHQNLAQLSDPETQARLLPFFEQRGKIWLKECLQNASLIEAVWQRNGASQTALNSLDQWVEVVETLKNLDAQLDKRHQPQQASQALLRVIESATRVDKILAAAQPLALRNIDPARFETAHENRLWQGLESVLNAIGNASPLDVQARIEHLDGLTDAIDAFFDNVLVNANDPAVKANRMSLLQAVHETYCQVARFSLIQI
ncbi:MAG: glycine--tRNA ligase subunit beta [Vampirovibrionales bacterium]|nr:glycine--tRNA ligase subunit beta [Vampirovibrionales bacterium]